MKRLGYIFMAMVFAVSLVSISMQPAYAFNRECDYAFFEESEIPMYDPCFPLCGTDLAEISEEANRTYDGRRVITTPQEDAIKLNQPLYETAAASTGVPWQLIASIHLYENNLQKVGLADGTGPYHDVSNTTYKVGELTDEEFTEASTTVATKIKSLAADESLEGAEGINTVKSALFAYSTNSTALATTKQLYVDQAKELAFSDDQAGRGEGSPYVMNQADELRDPSKARSGWGWVPEGQTSITYPAPNNFGVAVIYAALAGIDLATNTCMSGGLIPGGMNEEQAKAFMRQYISHVGDSEDEINNLLDPTHPWWWGNTCSPGPSPGLLGLNIPNVGSIADTQNHAASVLADCTAFSAYFIVQFTTLTSGSTNGGTWVDSLLSRNSGVNIETGTVPKPYSIFSTFNTGSAQGHTGVILGVDTDRQVVTVGQMGCNSSLEWGYNSSKEYPLSQYSSGYTYAYVEDFIKTDN